MAEPLLSVVFEGIIETLGSLAAKEIGLLWGVEDEFRSLTNVVSTIKAVLQDAEEKQAAGNNAVRLWLENLNDAIYDADDLLDAVSAEVLRREIMTRDMKAKQVRIFFSKSNQLFYRHKMGRKIKAMRERLDAINAARRDFHLEVCPMETRVGNRERDHTHSFVRAEAVIGREDDKKAVMHRLLDSNIEENVSILPIVGIGGLGKTTLAQLIFNDEQIEKDFELKMWVCVSDTFHVKSIVEKILESAIKDKPKPAEMDTLVSKLKKEIDGKKYLLVLDDVWNEEHEKWSRLKEVLMGGARGSRILLTTRNKSVARITGTIQSFSLKGLDKDESWSLFKQMAFEKEQEVENSSIIAIGKEILEKCSGVPLAIRTIGSLLRIKNLEIDWLDFKKHELSKISQNETDILPTLKLSYDHLPSHLKQCFAYCCLYPKDYQIRKSILVQLWMAQGFVKSSDPNRSLEDVGHEYFMDLLWRSFFEVVEMDEFGNVIQCKLHDLMHDLAKSVVGSLITTLDDIKRNVDEKTLHVSFIGDCNEIISSISTSLCKASRIRTFLCLDRHYNAKIDCDAIFSSFKCLRLLDLSCSSVYFVPSSIGRLQHLTYLDLSQNYFKKLPDSITKLHNLQKLRLYGCTSLKELPRDIRQLVNLRHLDIHECNALTYMPRGLGQLTKLKKLSRFVVHSGSHSRHSGGLKELNGLNNLRGELVILKLGYGKGVESEYEAANLKEKQHLRALHLKWSFEGSVNVSAVDVFDDESSLEGFQPHQNLKELRLFGYLGSRLSDWLLSLTNLVTFQLEGCQKCQYLPPLGELSSLKYLYLSRMDAMEYILDGSDSHEFSSSSLAPVAFFPSLKEIQLICCPNLNGWRRDSSVEVNSDIHNSVEITEHRFLPSFPCLIKLLIFDCPKLTSMPMFPHLEGVLDLRNASSKPLQQTMMMNMATSQSPTATSSSSAPLSKLKSITLNSIADLETLPPHNLTSLESLKIYSCHRLKSLASGIQHLAALEDLYLDDCPELELANDEDGMRWQGLTSLLSLSFLTLPKLVSLPSGLQHATTLQELYISNCESLTAIPEWIHNCKLLQKLQIYKCSSLASLPEEMRRLTSLQSLTIADCPILSRRCKRDTGEDWPKIAHIPKSYI